MNKQYTAEDAQNILAAFAEEFLVDIPAVHKDGNYLIEHNQLAGFLILNDTEWYQSVADYASAQTQE